MVEWTRYRLVDEQGADLGPLLSASRTWAVGQTVHRGQDVTYEVVRLVEAEATDEVDAYLVVRRSTEEHPDRQPELGPVES